LNRFVYQGSGVGGSGSGSTINSGGATHEGYPGSNLGGSSAHLVDAYESELTRRRISDDFESPNPSGDDGGDDQMMSSPPLEPLDAPFENREDSTCYN